MAWATFLFVYYQGNIWNLDQFDFAFRILQVIFFLIADSKHKFQRILPTWKRCRYPLKLARWQAASDGAAGVAGGCGCAGPSPSTPGGETIRVKWPDMVMKFWWPVHWIIFFAVSDVLFWQIPGFGQLYLDFRDPLWHTNSKALHLLCSGKRCCFSTYTWCRVPFKWFQLWMLTLLTLCSWSVCCGTSMGLFQLSCPGIQDLWRL